MQTALHILTLVDEMRREMVGGPVVSTEFYKKERAAHIFVKGPKTRVAFSFLYHPHGYGIFVVPASKVKVDTREKPWPIFELEGAVVTGVEQIGLDRLLTITVRAGAIEAKVVVEGLGANGNMWLLDAEGRIHGTLRKRDFTPGESYTPPEPFGGLDPFEVTAEDLVALAEEAPDSSPIMLLQKNITGFNRTLAIEAVHRSGIAAGDRNAEALAAVARTVRDLAGRFRGADIGYLHTVGGRPEVYPFKLTSVGEPEEKFKSLSLAVLHMTGSKQSSVEQADEEKTILQALGRAVKRLERRIANVESDIAQASDYERYRKFGELLQINFDAIKRGMESITVEDVYLEPHGPITIPLDPTVLPSENVESYFKRYRKGREGLELLQRRLEISRQEVEELRRMNAELELNFEEARERYRAELESLLPKEGAREESAARLPYREYTLSTGLRIFVGREGADNDRTTFEFAKPHETWLHTQQCPGSHVVIKHPNKSFEPSKQEISEAAAIAAWFSKARNDTMVPVIYTERRYVRKPRKAKPGLVMVEKEKSVMVAPRKPEE